MIYFIMLYNVLQDMDALFKTCPRLVLYNAVI